METITKHLLPRAAYIAVATLSGATVHKVVPGMRTYGLPLENVPPRALTAIEAGAIAKGFNDCLGVSTQQLAAMEGGVYFGWDTPAADPRNYDESGLRKDGVK